MSEWLGWDKIGPILLVVVGFVCRSAWDLLTKRRESLRDLQLKIRIARLETQLSEFYWPIYLRLIQNEATWEHLLGSPFGRVFEKEIVLPNHEAIVARIQGCAHLADADRDFRRLIAEYLCHVAVYKALRAAEDHRLPAQVHAPWPQGLNREFELRTLRLQREYDELLERRSASMADPDSATMFRDFEREARERMEATGLKPRS